MDKRFYAFFSVILGILTGWVASLFFYHKWIGLSFPLFTAVAVAVLFAYARTAGSPSRLRNLWVIPPLAFFALMVAIRADGTITLLNIAAVLWLGALLLHYRKSSAALDQESLAGQFLSVLTTGVVVPLEAPGQMIAGIGWLRDHQPLRGKVVRSVGRGLLLAVPIVGVFGALLASADTIFANYFNHILDMFQMNGLDDFISQSFIVVSIGWLACGALAYSVLRKTSSDARFVQVGDEDAVKVDASADAGEADAGEAEAGEAAPKKGKKHPFLLSIIESGIVLGAVDLLFGAFVVVQFAYFFGGRQNISYDGWTYAEYARRGFFELVAVSVLTLGLILWLDWVTVRSNRAQHTVFRALAVGVVALTGVMLVSASGRMSLYEEAYGFTHLRLYTHVFMGWLGALFVVFLGALFRPHSHVFSFGTTLCVIGFLATVNLINVDYTIARQNIERARSGHTLDTGYLNTLSVDAIPALLPYYLENPAGRRAVGYWLTRQQLWLDGQRADATLFSAHASRDAAWQMLDDARSQLPAYGR